MRFHANGPIIPDIGSIPTNDDLSTGVELSCNGGDRYAVLQQIFHLGLVIGS